MQRLEPEYIQLIGTHPDDVPERLRADQGIAGASQCFPQPFDVVLQGWPR
jgi:hypothetical protein